MYIMDKVNISPSEVFDLKLCQAVKSFPCLYDDNSEFFGHNQTCKMAWEDISNLCNDTVMLCKSRWTEIYDGFANDMRNSKTIINDDASNLNKCLKFLMPHIKQNVEISTNDTEKPLKCNESNILDEKPLKCNESNILDDTVERSQSSISSETISENETGLAHINIITNQVIKKNNESIDSKKNKEHTPAINNKNENVNDGGNVRNCQSKVETFIIKKEGIELENKVLKPPVNLVSAKDQQTQHQEHEQDINNAGTTNITKLLNISEAETEDEVKRYNFRRHCKRSLNDDELLMDKSKRKKPLSSIMDELNNDRKTPIMSPSRKLEVKVARMSFNKKVRPLRSKHNDLLRISQTAIMKKHNEMIDDNNKIKRKHTIDNCMQTDIDTIHLENEFLNSIQTQMKLMNARQGMHFKCKVYKALMEVFDDASNFPNRNEIIDLPATGAPRFDNTTTAELQLMRELVALVQAAKQTVFEGNKEAELNRVDPVVHTTDNSISLPSVTSDLNTRQFNSSPSLPSSTSIINNSNTTSMHIINHDSEDVLGVPRHIIRKVVKVGGVHGGTVMTQDGEKKRIYRIYPKVSTSLPNSISTHRITYNTTSQNNGGGGGGDTFLITQKDQANNTNQNQILASSSASSLSSSSSSVTSNPVRTMIVNNRNANINNLTKSTIMRTSDSNKTMLGNTSGSGTNILHRGTQIRLQPQTVMQRYATTTSNGITLPSNCNTTISNNALTIQKITPTSTTQTAVTTPNVTYKTVITNRRVQIPNTTRSLNYNNNNNNVNSSVDNLIIRSVKSMATNTAPTSQSTTIINGSPSPNVIGQTSVSRTFVTKQKPTQQQQQQQQSIQINRKLNNEKPTEETLIDPLQIKIKTEPTED